LKKNYGKGFGFVICCFDSTKKIEPHPLGYVGDFLPDGTMFVPCRHEHGHHTQKEEHFDHVIFSVNSVHSNTAPDHENPGFSVDEMVAQYGNSGSVPFLKPIEVFAKQDRLRELVTDITAFRKRVIVGNYKNVDLIFALHEEQLQKLKEGCDVM